MNRKSWLWAVASGVMFALSWPVHGFPFLIFVAWWPLFRLSDACGEGKCRGFFLRIYLAFFLFNLLTTYWIWYATPAGAVTAILANSLLMSLTFGLWHLARRRLPVPMATVLFPALWMSFEKLHYVWDLEWPWLTMGNVLASYPSLAQWYAYTGVFGGSLWVLAGALWLYRLSRRPQARVRAWVYFLLFLLVPPALSVGMYATYGEKGETARVLILQPNIDPWTEKFDRPNRITLTDLESLVPDSLRPDLILAPETALAQSINLNRLAVNGSISAIRERVRQSGTPWMLGISLYRILHAGKDSIPETANRARRGNYWYQLYNSALLVAPDSLMLYHKAILVPGAEKMPYRRWLKPLVGDWIIDLGGMSGTHTPSPAPVVFGLGKLRVAPIICYESIFGDYVRRYVLRDANLLAVISNDGWWKKSPGYRQHFDYARLRAIENRRDVVRAANTGKSGHINQRGDVVQSLDYGKRGIILARAHLNREETFYTRYGDYPARLAVFLAFLLLTYAFLGRKRFS